ncbi:predicted protein [Pyrenophora tritici-repentis Pt-1C-BFP]|uniref:Uncharacterized protein n=1 Tax=Pyrenophora tritici-repentis (strain Pt-1C-BFP) TaxID=426418 RepID=B2WD01_PYRTR|nr:uncharacterized protein PTRG_07860 [Pyrenophora tritici-repentis Pt-1C-BFP]EDU50779.1 predicted protein [Pyrenophora tritici-repentis Pt-1C-BFP]
MAEPSPSNTVQDIDIDPALMNGMTQQAPAEQPSTDVEMADSQDMDVTSSMVGLSRARLCRIMRSPKS